MHILTGSIDLTKIDTSKIQVTTLKNGSTAKFYPIQVIINDEPDQYGNLASVSTNRTKEERDSGVKPTYIGNLKSTYLKESEAPKKQAPQAPKENQGNDSDSLPF